MNKKAIGVVVIVLLAIGCGMTYLLASSDAKTEKQEMVSQSSKVSDQAPVEDSQGGVSAQPGKYIDYSQSAVASTPGTKLLFFHASWCPQCRALEADIKDKGVPSGVTIIKVDYDSNQALRQKYGVTLQTTVVRIDDQGNLVNKFVAYDDPSLKAVREKLL